MWRMSVGGFHESFSHFDKESSVLFLELLELGDDNNDNELDESEWLTAEEKKHDHKEQRAQMMIRMFDSNDDAMLSREELHYLNSGA